MEIGWKQRTSDQDAEAEQTFLAASRIAAEATAPHMRLGFLYLDQHRWEEALREFESVRHLDPEDRRPFFGLALAHHKLGRGAEYALALEQEGISLTSELPRQIVLALIAYDQGDMAQALYHYQKAQAMYSDNGVLTERIAHVLVRLHRYEEARAILLRTPPASSWTYYLLGYAEKGLGHRNAALKAFRTAVELKPDYQAALLQWTRLEWRLGHWRSAWHHFLQLARFEIAKVQQEQMQKSTKSMSA